jgi:hypothetical protein
LSHRDLTSGDLAEVAAVARHEAAHAVACIRHGQPFTRVRLHEGGVLPSVCGVTVPDGSWPVSEDSRIFTSLAGPAAEWAFRGGISDEQIVSAAREAVGRTPGGCDWDMLGEMDQGDWIWAFRSAEAASTEDWPAIEAVADALLEHGSLSQADVQQIVCDHGHGEVSAGTAEPGLRSAPPATALAGAPYSGQVTSLSKPPACPKQLPCPNWSG